MLELAPRVPIQASRAVPFRDSCDIQTTGADAGKSTGHLTIDFASMAVTVPTFGTEISSCGQSHAMKTLLYTGPWRMEVDDAPIPVPGPDEVLVDVRAVGICGSDVHGYTGSTGRRTPPMIMGHEFSGTVSVLGSNVQGVEEEDEVIVSPLFPYDGIGNRRVVGVNTQGAYAEHALVHKSMLYPKPKDMDWHLAAMCEPLSIALHALSRTPVALMDTVVIVGAGTIGLLTLLCARRSGAGTIVVTDMSEHRLEVARKVGADVVINVADTDPVAQVMAMTNQVGADVAIEAVGMSRSVQQAHAMVRVGGHITWIGNSDLMIEINMQEVVTRELTVAGTYGFSDEFERVIQSIASGHIDVAPLIERVAPLAEGPDIIEALAKGELDLIKVILEP